MDLICASNVSFAVPAAPNTPEGAVARSLGALARAAEALVDDEEGRAVLCSQGTIVCAFDRERDTGLDETK